MVVEIVLLSGGLEDIKMGVLRAFGYFIAIVIIIIGTLFLPAFGLGIPLVVGIIIMWALHKGGQVTSMQKELKKIRELEEEKARQQLDQRKKNLLGDGWENQI